MFNSIFLNRVSVNSFREKHVMRINIALILFIQFISIHSQALSATLIESLESDAVVQKTWVEGDQLRAETVESSQYMLMDFSRKKMYLVNPENKQVLDMSGIVASISESGKNMEEPDYTVTHVGNGPDIAGYPTKHYTVSFKGKKCIESFTSNKVVNEFSLLGFINGMKEMFPQGDDMNEKENPCAKAENALEYKKIGLPLRLVEEDGEESYRIIRLEKNAPIPSGGFSVPEDFHVIDYGEMILRMTQKQ